MSTATPSRRMPNATRTACHACKAVLDPSTMITPGEYFVETLFRKITLAVEDLANLKGDKFVLMSLSTLPFRPSGFSSTLYSTWPLRASAGRSLFDSKGSSLGLFLLSQFLR